MKKTQFNTTDDRADMIDQFNEVLFKHLNRLIGSKLGIGELILNIITISVITLLAERENELESFPSDEMNHYSRETLIKDMEEMGLDDIQDLNIFIEDMIQKDYIRVLDDRFIPQKPSISMAHLIDLVFPKMPGMNLIAYFAQTVDEVKSNRKDIKSALEQFDQTLHMQGAPLEKGSQRQNSSKASVQPDDKRPLHEFDKPQKDNDDIFQNKEFKTSSIPGQKSKNNLFDLSKDSPNEPKVLSSDAYNGKVKITKLIFGETESNKVGQDNTPSDKYEKRQPADKLIETLPDDFDESQNSEIKSAGSFEASNKNDSDEQIRIENISLVNIHPPDSLPSVEQMSENLTSRENDENNAYDDKNDLSNADSDHNKNEAEDEKVENNAEALQKIDDFSLTPATIPADQDDDIEKRIMAFEENLALECPLCKKSKVLTKSTATGKSYYKCSNKECSFISWGKPHHIFCPKCNNPFLIETSNNTGIINLKCPRATCRYRKEVRSDLPANEKESMGSAIQTPNKTGMGSQKPRRRIVRRRVVRRKS